MFEETSWFNQTCLSYSDKIYQTSSFLRINHSISTVDFCSFNSAYLNISITSNGKLRTSSINYENSIDLLETLKEVMSNNDNFFSNNVQIDKRYKTDQLLVFKFQKASASSGEKVVTIQIYRNESDFGEIIVPFQLFRVMAFIIKSFVENHISIGSDLRRDMLLTETLKVKRQLANDIRNLPNQLISIPGNNVELSVMEEKSSDDMINRLDEFIGGKDLKNINDIEIPDINKSVEYAELHENIEEVHNSFVEKVLLNDLQELEKILELVTTSNQGNPFITLCNKFNNNEFPLLPDISEKDLKSISYLSKLFYMTHFRNNIENGIGIPISFFDLKYKPNKSKIRTENINLAYNLLLFMGYIREVRNRLESKISDSITNKAIMYLGLRCFCDVFTFSFLDNAQDLVTTIVSYFETYNKTKIFDYYKGLLKDNNCTQITKEDIQVFASQISEKVIGKTILVNQLHDELFNSKDVKIPSENPFTSEQIINEIVSLEVNEKLGFLTEFELEGRNSEIVKLFEKKEEKNEKKKEQKEKISNLARIVLEFENEILPSISEEVWDFVKKYENRNCDLKEISSILSDLGENIIKAFYLWNPDDDEKLKYNYSYFHSKIEKETMGKHDIIISINESSSNEESSLWMSGFNLE